MASSHYVNNPDFLKAIKEYKALVKAAEAKGEPKPQVSNYIGECILKIANHLSYKPNFINYTYRDEMIADGIENCLTYVDNFDPEKSSNPFAYFTQIIYYAFLRRIAKEKKQTYIKGKIIQELPFDAFEIQDHDEDGQFINGYIDYMQNNDIEHMIKPASKRKKKEKVVNNLDDFIEE